MVISIHAPTRGATIKTLPGNRSVVISIHAPTRGATAGPSSRLLPPGIFQSTLPRGERRGIYFLTRTDENDFNPRSHEGSDPLTSYSRKYSMDFNPRSHEGSDTDPSPHIRMTHPISIHAPTRGATVIDPARTPRAYKISIHAPTRGATDQKCRHGSDDKISIHAPTRGATDMRQKFIEECTNFNPRSHEGSDF